MGPLANIPVWGIFVVTLLVVLLSIEAGFRMARFKRARLAHREGESEAESSVGAAVGATLGLLAFLLGFAFSIAEDGFQARKAAVLEEANAIRTCYLRADLVAEPHRTEVRRLLREYVDERLQWAGVDGLPQTRAESELLDALWAHVSAVGRANPGLEVVSLFVDSANEVIAVGAVRDFLRERNRLPAAFGAMLFMITIASFFAMGYHGGVAGTLRSPVVLAVAVAFSLVAMLISDIDRPGEGWVNVSQAPMIQLRDSLGPRVP